MRGGVGLALLCNFYSFSLLRADFVQKFRWTDRKVVASFVSQNSATVSPSWIQPATKSRRKSKRGNDLPLTLAPARPPVLDEGAMLQGDSQDTIHFFLDTGAEHGRVAAVGW